MGLTFSEKPYPEYDPARSLRELGEHELSHQQKDYLKSLEGERPDFSTKVQSHILPCTEIGYFKIDMFDDAEFSETRTIIDEAMKKIVDAKALIIDLRENSGGDASTVAIVASYLFDEKQLINRLYQRCSDETTCFFAEPEKLEQVFGGKKPIYVLISQKTFSGGEELAYNLKVSERAELIGQTTWGGAHPVRSFVIDDHICATIPFAKAINPHTGTNWEGVGVTPDYRISQEEDGVAFALNLLNINPSLN
ncbi:MAG: S41 family peptidase [Chlamydiota bacterium]